MLSFTVKALLVALSEELGLNLVDPNFKDTPQRVANTYKELLSGTKDTKKQIDAILEKRFPSTGYRGIIFSPNILTYSLCPHHLLPVKYVTALGYIPSDSGFVLGASKLARVVEVLSHRAVLQEKFTTDVVNYLDAIKPKGIAVVVSGEHYCMRARGVKQQATFETSAVTGVFKQIPEARKEFFDLLTMAENRRR